MRRPKAILLVGPTGAGKSPLGDLLEARGLQGRRCFHFDFGHLLRLHVGGASGLLTAGEVAYVREALHEGALLSDQRFPIAGKILHHFIARCGVGAQDLVVLNGLPRDLRQAERLDDIVDVEGVVELRCAPEVVLERIRKDAGGDRIERVDDDAASVRRRLETFKRSTEPMLGHYRKCGVPIRALDVQGDTTAAHLWRQLNEG